MYIRFLAPHTFLQLSFRGYHAFPRGAFSWRTLELWVHCHGLQELSLRKFAEYFHGLFYAEFLQDRQRSIHYGGTSRALFYLGPSACLAPFVLSPDVLGSGGCPYLGKRVGVNSHYQSVWQLVELSLCSPECWYEKWRENTWHLVLRSLAAKNGSRWRENTF